MIMMGGGTGFAPLKSMIEDLLSHRNTRPLHLFWGARSAAELYQEELIMQWVADHPHIEYTPAVSDETDRACRRASPVTCTRPCWTVTPISAPTTCT